jgi:hypothetical protein
MVPGEVMTIFLEGTPFFHNEVFSPIRREPLTGIQDRMSTLPSFGMDWQRTQHCG